MAGFKPLQFLGEVKREVKKVTWPTMTETRMTTIMVVVMVIISSLFLFTVDQIVNSLIKMILGIKG